MTSRLTSEESKIMKEKGLTGLLEFINGNKSNDFSYMGDPETPRYKILKTLNRFHALSYSDLKRESRLANSTLYYCLNDLINERIIVKWYFDNHYVLFSHCFIPWYEVEEIYEKKYSDRTHTARNRQRTGVRNGIEQALKD